MTTGNYSLGIPVQTVIVWSSLPILSSGDIRSPTVLVMALGKFMKAVV